MNCSAAIASPGGSDRGREPPDIADHGIERQLSANGSLQIRGVEPLIPGIADVGESGRMQGVEKQRKRAVPSLRTHQWKAVVQVQQRYVPARKGVAAEATQQTDGVPTEIHGQRIRLSAAKVKYPLERVVSC